MSHSAADRNLLMGMLALQLNFVSREELIAAASKWTRNKHRSIAEVLNDDGLLSEEESQLLSGLVDKHLARHGNDPAQGLASAAAAKVARRVVEATGDRAMFETLNQLEDIALRETKLREPATTDDRFATVTPAEEAAAQCDATAPPADVAGGPSEPHRQGDAVDGDRAARYTVIKPYQRGGLGQVSIARDEEINREVALKEILPKHADSEEARARFLLEAEITGSLEHPGVVPVYGLGQYADGRPYYAMRFIRGDNLQLAIDEFHRNGGIRNRELEFRQLLRRFTDVCNAIEYAHNRCVLHRDLKPGNIMLGKYGETLVVDWGLAKSVDAHDVPTDTVELPVRPLSADPATETQMGRVVGTPAYMSPEQASGRVDILGPATDVYSLGATLFHLLAGEAPFKDAPRNTLISSVQKGRFKKPRDIKPDVPRPLEAICLKAMARDASDRYHAARALAEDVERYLADEPVAAYRDPWHARTFRWMRKHRSLVVSAAGILTVAAVALTLGVILLGAANRRVQAQRERAERNFEMARNAVRDFFTNVSEDTLLNQEGMQPLRNQLLAQALSYYEEFLQDGSAEAEMRDDVAQANYHVGVIKEYVASWDVALPFYDRAIAIYRELVAETPRDAERLYDYGMALNAQGRALHHLGRLQESRSVYNQARAVRQQLANAFPDKPEYLRLLANSIMNLGSIDVASEDNQRQEEGIQRWIEAQSLRKEKLDAGIDLPKLLRDFGKGSFNLGHKYVERNELGAAREQLSEAIRTFELLLNQSTDEIDAQLNLALAYRTMGDIPADADADDNAGAGDALRNSAASYERAIDLLAVLALRNPQVPKYREELAATRISFAELLFDEAQTERGFETLAEAILAYQGLAEQDTDEPFYREELAYARELGGQTHAKRGETDEARGAFEAAIHQYEELVRRFPAEASYARQLEDVRMLLEGLQPAPGEE